MDSFGVDLDKVLDDFEESETINVDSNGVSPVDYSTDTAAYGCVPPHCPTVFQPYAGDNSSLSDCEYLKPTSTQHSSIGAGSLAAGCFTSTSSSLASTPGTEGSHLNAALNSSLAPRRVSNGDADESSMSQQKENNSPTPPASNERDTLSSISDNKPADHSVQPVCIDNNEQSSSSNKSAVQCVDDGTASVPINPSLILDTSNQQSCNNAPAQLDSRPDIACTDDIQAMFPDLTPATPDDELSRPDLMSTNAARQPFPLHLPTIGSQVTPDLTSSNTTRAVATSSTGSAPDLTSTQQSSASPDVTPSSGATSREYSHSSSSTRPDITSPCKSRSLTSPDVTMSPCDRRSCDGPASSSSRPDITSTGDSRPSAAATPASHQQNQHPRREPPDSVPLPSVCSATNPDVSASHAPDLLPQTSSNSEAIRDNGTTSGEACDIVVSTINESPSDIHVTAVTPPIPTDTSSPWPPGDPNLCVDTPTQDVDSNASGEPSTSSSVNTKPPVSDTLLSSNCASSTVLDSASTVLDSASSTDYCISTKPSEAERSIYDAEDTTITPTTPTPVTPTTPTPVTPTSTTPAPTTPVTSAPSASAPRTHHTTTQY